MKNIWLASNEVNLDRIKKLLVELEYLPIFQDYPVRTIHSLFRGFEGEVIRLQNEVNSLKKEFYRLNKENEQLQKKTDETKTE